MNLTDKFATKEQNNPIRTIAIMANQLASMATCLIIVRSINEGRLELADMATQCLVMGEQLDVVLYEPDDPIDIGGKKNFPECLFVMMMSLGNLSRCVIYSGKGDSTMHPKPEMLSGYLLDASIHLGAIWSNLQAMARESGWNWDDLLADGEERFLYRMEEIRRREI